MPQDDEAASPAWVTQALDTITRLLSIDADIPLPEGLWEPGAAPTSGPSFLLADGYLSRSTGGKPRYTHLIEHFDRDLSAARPCWPIHGLNFRRPHHHYRKQNTQFNPLLTSVHKFFRYAPKEGTETTYIGYSLGALTILLGLDHILSTDGFPVERLAERCPMIVLCQPAFALGPDVQSQLAQMDHGDPITLLAMARRRRQILAKVERALGRLQACGVRVVIVAWEEDQFIDLSPNVLDRTRTLDVEVELVSIPSFTPRPKSPFHEHCFVPFQRPFLDKLREIVAAP